MTTDRTPEPIVRLEKVARTYRTAAEPLGQKLLAVHRLPCDQSRGLRLELAVLAE